MGVRVVDPIASRHLRAAAVALTLAAPVARGVAQGAPAARVRVGGTVSDSLTFGVTSLAGATVQLVDAANPALDRTAVTDARGRFALDGVAPGRYLLGFVHPRLDVLGIELRPRLLEVPATGLADVALATPGAGVVRRALCGAAVPDSAGVVVGIVRDADTDTPLAGATVTFRWNAMALTRASVTRVERRVPVPTQAGGVYAVCGVPTDEDVMVTAAAPGRASGPVAVSAEVGGLVIQELAVGDSAWLPPPQRRRARDAVRAAPPAAAARGTARLAGVVRREDGSPAAGAEVSLWGTGVSARVGDDGAYLLTNLPAGTFEAEARAVGFQPHRRPVALASGRTATADLVVDSRVPVLAPVVVRGRRVRGSRVIDGFLRRRQQGNGVFLSADDIDRRAMPLLTDLFWNMRGTFVQVTGTGDRRIRMRGSCRPTVVVDGQRVLDGADQIDRLVRPADALAIEVYPDPTVMPVEFGGLPGQGSSCGLIAIWTRI